MMPGKQANLSLSTLKDTGGTAPNDICSETNGMFQCVQQRAWAIPDGCERMNHILQSSIQGPRFQNENTNNSDEMNTNGFAQVNDHRARLVSSTRGSGSRNALAQRAYFRDTLETGGIDKSCAFVAHMIGLNPSHEEIEKVTENKVYGTLSTAPCLTQFTRNISDSEVAKDYKLSYSVASDSKFSVTGKQTLLVSPASPLSKPSRRKPAVASMPDTAMQYELRYAVSPAKRSRLQVERETKRFLDDTERCNQMETASHKRMVQPLKDIPNLLTVAQVNDQRYPSTSCSNMGTPGLLSRTGISSVMPGCQNRMSAAEGKHTVVFRPANPPLQQSSPNILASTSAADPELQDHFPKVSNSNIKVLGYTKEFRFSAMVSPQRSKEENCDEDTMPKIIACYSLSSKANEKNSIAEGDLFNPNFTSITVGENAVNLSKIHQPFPSDFEQRQNVASTNTVPSSQRNVKPFEKAGSLVHLDESVSNAVKAAKFSSEVEDTLALTSGVVSCEKRSLTCPRLPGMQTGLDGLVSDKLPCCIDFILAHKNARKEVVNDVSISERSSSHEQNCTFLSKRRVENFQTMRMVENYTPPVIISKNSLPSTSCHDSRLSVAVSSTVVKSPSANCTLSLAFSDTTTSNATAQVVCKASIDAVRQRLIQNRPSLPFVCEKQTYNSANTKCQVAKNPVQNDPKKSSVAYLESKKRNNVGASQDPIRMEKEEANLAENKALLLHDEPLDYSIETLKMLGRQSCENAMDLSLPKATVSDSPQNLVKPTVVESKLDNTFKVSTRQDDHTSRILDPVASLADTLNFQTSFGVALSHKDSLNQQPPTGCSHLLTSSGENDPPRKSSSSTFLEHETEFEKSLRGAEKRNKKLTKPEKSANSSMTISLKMNIRTENVFKRDQNAASHLKRRGLKEANKSTKTGLKSNSDKRRSIAINSSVSGEHEGSTRVADAQPCRVHSTQSNIGYTAPEAQINPDDIGLHGDQTSSVVTVAKQQHFSQDVVSRKPFIFRPGKTSTKFAEVQSQSDLFRNENKGALKSSNCTTSIEKSERYGNFYYEKLPAKHKEKLFVAKDVKLISNSRGETEKKLVHSSKTDKVYNENIASKGNHCLSATVHENTGSLDDISKGPNSLNLNLRRPNSAEMKNNLFEILEIADAMPELLETMLKARNPILAAKETLNENTDADVIENLLRQVGISKKKCIAEKTSENDTNHNIENEATENESDLLLLGVPVSPFCKDLMALDGIFEKSGECSGECNKTFSKIKKVGNDPEKVRPKKQLIKNPRMRKISQEMHQNTLSLLIPALGKKKRWSFDSDCLSASRKIPLKLGYNVNANWSGSRLKIKRRKLIKKLDVHANGPKTIQKKSTSAFILFSDSSNSSDEGVDSRNSDKIDGNIIGRNRPRTTVTAKDRRSDSCHHDLPTDAARNQMSVTRNSNLLTRLVDNPGSAVEETSGRHASHTRIFTIVESNKDITSETSGVLKQNCDSSLSHGEDPSFQCHLSTVSSFVDGTKQKQLEKRLKSARMKGNWKTQEWPDLTKHRHKPLPCLHREIRTKAQRVEHIFMAMQKLFEMGVITERTSTFPNAAVRQRLITASRIPEIMLVSGQSKARNLSAPFKKANEFANLRTLETRSSDTDLQPCTVWMKNSGVERKTMEIMQ